VNYTLNFRPLFNFDSSMRLFLLFMILAWSPLRVHAQRAFLWEASSERGKVYLLGSVHLLPLGTPVWSPAIEAAFDSTNVLVMEMDVQQASASAMSLMQHGLISDGRSLSEVIGEELMEELAPKLETIGPARGLIERAKPWFAAMLLSSTALTSAGFAADAGVDLQVAQRALQAGRTLHALETAQDQINVFDMLPEDVQVAFLRYTVRDLDDSQREAGGLAQLWIEGDAETLQARMGEGMSSIPDLREALLDARNQRWVPQILSLLAEGRTPFVVVGAGHLVGPGSVLDLLRQEGFQVVRK